MCWPTGATRAPRASTMWSLCGRSCHRAGQHRVADVSHDRWRAVRPVGARHDAETRGCGGECGLRWRSGMASPWRGVCARAAPPSYAPNRKVLRGTRPNKLASMGMKPPFIFYVPIEAPEPANSARAIQPHRDDSPARPDTLRQPIHTGGRAPLFPANSARSSNSPSSLTKSVHTPAGRWPEFPL